MIVSIHQPNYLPWLGYFHKISECDIFVFLDNVLYSKGWVINRNKIKTPDGWTWLTVPLRSHGILEKRMCEVEISDAVDWGKKHLKSIKYCYGRAVYYDEYKSFFKRLYARKWDKLAKLNEEIIYYIVKKMDINKTFVKASDLNVQGLGMDLIINICKVLGADTYYSGIGGMDYQDEKSFLKAGIKLVYQNFQHPIYEQRFGEFIPNLSAIDLLFNYGPQSIDILLGNSEADVK